jgi:hypothetical protein
MWDNIILAHFKLVSRVLQGKRVGPNIPRTLHQLQINLIVVYFKLQIRYMQINTVVNG